MRPSFLFAVILVLVAVAATSGPTDFVKERYRRCGGAFDCANIKNISYPFWGPNRPTYCGHPVFELECTGENPVITIRSERYRILDINLVGRSFAVARADYKDTSCPRTLSNTTIDPTLFRFGSDSQNLTLYYDCPPPATVLGPATLVSAIAANGFNCSNVTGYWRNSVKDTSGAPPAMVEYLAACRLSVLVPAFRALAREIGSLRSLLNSGFGLEWDANNEVCSNCAASGGRCGHESGHFACFCSRGVFPAACITGKNNNRGLVIGIAAGSAAAVGIGLLSAAYFVVRRRKHLKIAHSKTGGGGPSASSMPTASPYAGTPMVPLTNFHESTPSYGGGRPDLESGGTYLGVRVFSYDELEEATDNFDASKELGDGGFGVVYYGKLRDGRAVAVKRLYERNFKRVEQFMNEVQILTRLCHPNLVTLYGCTSRRSRELLLVYEYIPNGTLADHLHGNLSGSGSLPWPLRLAIAMETAAALAYLHSSDIIHRDVKTTNILLDCNFHVKVADFGLSRLFPNDVTHVSTAPQGTPGYVDPEYYQCYHLTDRSDVYSFGVVLVELVSSKKAVDTNRHRHDVNLANMAVSKMQSRSLHELVDPCLGFEGDEEVRRAVMAVAELAFLCLQLDREMRPSMDEVVEGLRRIESRTDGMKINYIINDDALGGGVRGVKREVVHSVSPSSVVNAQWASVPTAPNSF